jgi:hypothetical protein
LVTIEEFKKMAEPNFYNPVLNEFQFLETDYGFQSVGSAVSYESSIIYVYDNINISIFHAFLEAPSLVLKNVVSGKILEEKTIVKPVGTSAKKAFKQLSMARNEMGIDEWCSNFRSGIFNESINEIVHDYALIVKSNIDRIREGNFKLTLSKE